jgi:hypothetical protein
LRELPARLLFCGGVLPLARSVSAQSAKQLPAIPDLKAIARRIDQGLLGPADLPLPQILTQGGGPLARNRLTGEGRAARFRPKLRGTEERVNELREKAGLSRDGVPP